MFCLDPLCGRGRARRERSLHMAFALVLGLILVVSTAYLVREWYTGELQEPNA
jgi:hypothetical protein